MINAILPLFIGILIYFITSPDVIFVKASVPIFGMITHREYILEDNGWIRFIRNYMPDILWAYALVFVLYFVLGNSAARVKTTLLIALVFSTVMEVMQLFPIIPGTFDVMDILAEAIAVIIAVFVIKKHYEEAGKI